MGGAKQTRGETVSGEAEDSRRAGVSWSTTGSRATHGSGFVPINLMIINRIRPIDESGKYKISLEKMHWEQLLRLRNGKVRRDALCFIYFLMTDITCVYCLLRVRSLISED